ncbi:MAG: hypothetical protein RLZZ628_1598 [Bacteroidota bacterium]|jgi:hypothetical protein
MTQIGRICADFFELMLYFKRKFKKNPCKSVQSASSVFQFVSYISPRITQIFTKFVQIRVIRGEIAGILFFPLPLCKNGSVDAIFFTFASKLQGKFKVNVQNLRQV